MGIADRRGEAVEGFVERGTECRRSTSRGTASSISRGPNVILGDNDNDDDDDFMPMVPRPGARGIGRTRSTSRAGSSTSRGPNVIPGDNDNDDDDDFMPMAPRCARPRSPEGPDDVCPPSPLFPPIPPEPRMERTSYPHMSRFWSTFVSTYISTLVCMECTYDAALYSNTVCKYIPRLSWQEHQAYQLLALSRWNIKVNIMKSYETE